MDIKEIKDNLDNFEIKTNVDVDGNNFYLTIEINDITKKLFETYIPTGLTDKRADIFFPDDAIAKRFLYLKVLATELEQVRHSPLLYEENLITNKRTQIELDSVPHGLEVVEGLKAGLMKVIELAGKLKALNTTIKVEAND